MSSLRPIDVSGRQLLSAALLLMSSLPALGQEQVFDVNAAQSKVAFTLGDILHTVHGTFQLKPGVIQFDQQTGTASGELVVDANSGDSGNGARDSKMKKEILQTLKYPEITFIAQTFHGKLMPQGTSHVQVGGIFTLHGDHHPMTLDLQVTSTPASTSVDTSFVVPYVKWGLKNPSTLFLRVSDHVEIAVHAVGRLASALNNVK